MKTRSILMILFFWPIYAMAVGFPSFLTEIPGVQLWDLSTYDLGFPEEGFEDTNNEFIRYCNGTRPIYVSSLNSPVLCKSEPTGENTYRIYLKSKDKRLSGLVVVSKKPLASRAKTLPITAEESEKLKEIEQTLVLTLAQEAKRNYLELYSGTPGIDSASYEKMLKEIKTELIYQKFIGRRFKISSPKGSIYISAIGLLPDGLGWNIQNVVFREVNGKFERIGDFFGCIEGFRDLDADGSPEVLTRLCENSEGTDDNFLSLSPTIHRVVTRSQ
jgi:hypothetical protein